MVSEQDLKKDYEEILKSGELDKPHGSKILSIIQLIILAIVILILTFWTVAWFY